LQTIGDCQSILLKLTNERCAELRHELNEATRRQIEAEEVMREEADDDDGGFMTEAEMTYLASMEEVKNISRDLVIAEQSFTLVRDRIEKLVAKYEALLVKIETESFAGASSVMTCESSMHSDQYGSQYWDEEEEEEREATMWARRARRAEIKAELAAREAMMAKQQARQIQQEKQRELEALQQKLLELQSEASNAISEREHSAILARTYTPIHPPQRAAAGAVSPAPDMQETMSHASRIDKEKIDGVKQRFRDRMAAKNQGGGPSPSSSSPLAPSATLVSRYGRLQHQPSLQRINKPSPPQRATVQSSLMRSAGEEMFSHLDFYERSLKSVAQLRDASP
jgi:hypothetical protein